MAQSFEKGEVVYYADDSRSPRLIVVLDCPDAQGRIVVQDGGQNFVIVHEDRLRRRLPERFWNIYEDLAGIAIDHHDGWNNPSGRIAVVHRDPNGKFTVTPEADHG